MTKSTSHRFAALVKKVGGRGSFMEILKAGKIRGVAEEVMGSIVKLCDGPVGFDCQVVGESLEDTGVVILRPIGILAGDEGEKKLKAIAELLGVRFEEISDLHFLDVWDDR